MISDEPNEDADALDDEHLLQSYLGTEPLKPDPGGDSGTILPDWPPSREQDLESHFDPETLAWFKANHANWRLEMSGVLRAWVAAKTHVSAVAKLMPGTDSGSIKSDAGEHRPAAPV